MLSETIKSEYLDFENYIFPDYQDYMDQYPDKEELDKINMPINTIRSCSWSKCKFCDFNKGYKLRIRTPKCIVNELEYLTNKFGLSTFSFVDSDTFGSFEHFEELLDLIIDLRFRNEVDYVFWAEIIPNIQFTANLMEKMAIAGFKNIFIGYDGLSDSMLMKMNKSNSFSDNIFFVKHSLKNGISPIVNVIKHVPGESEEDVQECVDNLHYLRFFYNNSIHKFEHIYVNLVLSSMTKYYRVMPDDERKKYNIDELTYLMPEHFSNHEDRFHLFRFEKETKSNIEEWEKIIEIENYYKSNCFTFKIQENSGTLYYTEYCNDTEIENIVFAEKEYASLLKIIEAKVYLFSEVFSEMKKIYPEISEGKVKQVLRNLKESYLLYYGADFSNIVSVVSLSR